MSTAPFKLIFGGRHSSATAADSSLLEFEHPSAALLAAPVRPVARSILWTVISLVAASIAAAVLVPIDMVVTAQGRVVSVMPTVVVQPLETAIVREINVREGEVVRAGQLMARLDQTFSAADVGSLEAQVRSFEAEVNRLTAEANDEVYVPVVSDPAGSVQAAVHVQRRAQYRAQVESYTQRISSLQAQLRQAQADAEAFKQRADIAADIEGRRRELEDKQVGSLMDRLRSQDQLIEMRRNLSDATGTAERITRDLEQVQADRDAFEQQWKAQVSQDLHDRSRSLITVQENLRKATLRRDLVELRAEQDAVVLTIAKVSVGSVMQSGDQFITLVPLASRMEVEARIAGGDAGYVREGEKVVVKFDTFPYVQYGTALGSVRTLSADSFVGREESQRAAGFDQVPAYYKTRVAIDEINMHVPGGFQLKPGMPVTADIKVGKRNLFSYLLARLLPVGLEGMREP